MTYGRISKKQQEILDYMKNEILNRGFPPSVREICEAVNLKSTSSVHSHLEALEKNGYIRRGCQCSSCRHCCCRTADPGSGKYRCLLSDPG